MSDETFIPIDDIPDQSTVPDDAYEVVVGQLEATESKSSGKLMYKVQLRIADGPFANVPLFDNFVIGSDDDPDASDPNTWKRFGGVRFKQFLKSTGIPLSTSFTTMAQAIQGQHCVAIVQTENSEQYGAQNRIKRYVLVGEAEVGQAQAAAGGFE